MRTISDIINDSNSNQKSSTTFKVICDEIIITCVGPYNPMSPFVKPYFGTKKLNKGDTFSVHYPDIENGFGSILEINNSSIVELDSNSKETKTLQLRTGESECPILISSLLTYIKNNLIEKE